MPLPSLGHWTTSAIGERVWNQSGHSQPTPHLQVLQRLMGHVARLPQWEIISVLGITPTPRASEWAGVTERRECWLGRMELPKYWKTSPLLLSPLLSTWLSHTTETRCGAGAIPWHRLEVPQSNSDPTLSAWRWHQIPHVKVSVLQDCLLTCRRPTSCARKYRVSPAFPTPSTLDYRFQQLLRWVQLIF